MSRLLFLTLPVADLSASRAFFVDLGFRFDTRCPDENAASMVINETAFVILIQRERFAEFVERPVAEATSETALTLAICATDRRAVDALADAALVAGATPAKPPQEYGFMYQRSFHDLDGHLWEVLWMDSVPEQPN